jgi:hypothetical protein
MLRRLSLGASILCVLALSGAAWAQAGPSAVPGEDSGPGAQGPSSGAPPRSVGTETGVPPGSPGASSPGTIIIQPAPAGGTSFSPARDPNADLPSSSRPIQGNERDGFDLDPSGRGGGVVFGGKGAPAIIGRTRSLEVPSIHVVKKGDTLWDLCDSYYQNPWSWPKVWSYNPQVLNPHWIYPGDQLRLRDPNDSGAQRRELVAGATPAGIVGGRGRVPPQTLFLRDQGFLGDPKRDVLGVMVFAVE